MIRPSPARWLFGLMWLILIALAITATILSQRTPPPPPGWQVWPDAGSILALAEYQGRVYAGGYGGLAVCGMDGVLYEVASPGGGPWEVNCLLPAPDGGLLVGHDQGLAVLSADGDTYLVPLPCSKPTSVLAMALDQHGTLWLGSAAGMFCAQLSELSQPGAVQLWEQATGLAAGKVTACLIARDGALWTGTYCAPAGGVSRWDGTAWEHWTVNDGLPHPNITSLLQTSDGGIWVGCGFKSHGGAARFAETDGSWRMVETLGETELAGPKVRSLFEDAAGRLWLGSEQDGLTIRHENVTLVVVTPEDGLPCLEVMSFTEANDGGIWIGTLFGLARLDPLAVDHLLSGT